MCVQKQNVHTEDPMAVKWTERYSENLEKLWKRIPESFTKPLLSILIFVFGIAISGDWITVLIHAGRQFGFISKERSDSAPKFQLSEISLESVYLKDLGSFLFFSLVVSYGMYFGVGGFLHWYYYIRQRDRPEEWKCQPKKWLTPELERHEILLGTSTLLLNATGSAFLSCYIYNGGYSTVYYNISDYGWLWFILQWPVIFIYKVAWLRVDTQTILTIHNHVVTKNRRIGVTHSELKTWYLHIREVRETDRGWYMCQINTDPMKSQICYLDVVVPPDILDFPTSADVVADEGSDVTLRCAARGSPEPSIIWKREDGQYIPSTTGIDLSTASGPSLNLTRIKRQHMGPYLCIASNGVPPSVSKRIMVTVQFPPSIWIQYQLVGAYEGQQITLECHTEAYPKSINYWARDNGEIIPYGLKYTPEIIDHGYKVHMKLTLSLMGPEDFGIYKCISKNSLGDMEGTINIYKIPNPNLKNSSIFFKNRGSTKETSDITYPTEHDRTDLFYVQDEYSSCAHQMSTSLNPLYLPILFILQEIHLIHPLL